MSSHNIELSGFTTKQNKPIPSKSVKLCCFTCHNNNIQQWSFDQLKHKKYQHPHLPFIHKTSNPHILHTEHQYCIKWRALPLFTDKPTKLISVKISKYFRYWTLKRLQNFLWISEENHSLSFIYSTSESLSFSQYFQLCSAKLCWCMMKVINMLNSCFLYPLRSYYYRKNQHFNQAHIVETLHTHKALFCISSHMWKII